MCTEEHDFEDSGPLIYVKGHMTLEVVKTKYNLSLITQAILLIYNKPCKSGKREASHFRPCPETAVLVPKDVPRLLRSREQRF